MGKKKEYKEANRRFLKNLSFQEGVFALPCGIYYKILETGEGTRIKRHRQQSIQRLCPRNGYRTHHEPEISGKRPPYVLRK